MSAIVFFSDMMKTVYAIPM